MTGSTVFAWWQWALLGAVPVMIVLLYFLKLKRQPQVVPSTYLWRRTIEDIHVNSIWQRLRNNLLLILQLLLILLLLIALLRPGWHGLTLSENRIIFLIDNSASMQATDGTPSRMAAARDQALQLVDQMQTGDVGMVITFSDTSRVVQTYTESRRLLRSRIEAIQPTNRPTDVREALRAAAGLANPGFTRLRDNQAVDEALPAALYLISDGAFSSVPDFSLGNLNAQYLAVGRREAANLGIVAFATERNPEHVDQMQAFVSVANSGPHDASCEIELFLDDQSIDVVRLDVPTGGERGWYFDLPNLEEGLLRAQLVNTDRLSLDNVAYAVINRARKAKVLLITPGNQPLRLALTTKQAAKISDLTIFPTSVLTDPSQVSAANAGKWDLIIYDRCHPESMPAANTLIIADKPVDTGWTSSPRDGPATVIDVDVVHPVTQLVDMSRIAIVESHVLKPPSGSSVLIDSVLGPICAIAPRGGHEDLVIGFPLLDEVDGESIPNTTWPRRSSFPVFFYNVLRYMGGNRGPLTGNSIRPGQPVRLPLESSVQKISITGPDQTVTRLQRESTQPFLFAGTDQLGVYEVRESDRSEVTHRIAVNLFDSVESDLATRASIELGHEEIVGRPGLKSTRRELWKWLVLLGLGVLAIEWYVYHRRITM